MLHQVLEVNRSNKLVYRLGDYRSSNAQALCLDNERKQLRCGIFLWPELEKHGKSVGFRGEDTTEIVITGESIFKVVHSKMNT